MSYVFTLFLASFMLLVAVVICDCLHCFQPFVMLLMAVVICSY